MAFRSKSNLYAHFKIHSDEKKYECPECHRCFKMKNTLDQHMVTHSDLRPYLCDLCGFSTKFQSHLISHRRTHTGDVYKCNIPNCNYSTPKKSQLKSHMRSHLGIRRHVCSTCGKAFVEKSHLIRHERIHSAERTFICNQCDYSSTRGDKLREHQQKHHSEDTERVKKAKTGKSKKSGAGNSNKKRVTLPSHENSLVEVVLVKNKKKKTAQNQRSEAIMRAVVGSAGGASLDSQFQFQPLLGESVTGNSINEQVGNMARMMENSIDRMVDGGRQELLTKGVKHESERQLSTAEILERMGLSMADVTSGGDPVFSYGSQTDTNTSQRNFASDRQTTMVSTSSFPDSKQTVTNQTSYQLQQQNMLPGNIRVPTFSAINTSSQSAALNSHFGHLVQPQVNLVPIATPDPSSVVSLLSDPPIMVPNSRGSSSLPTHNYHYHQQQQPHHLCQNQQQAQQQHQQHAESSSLPRIGDYLL